MFISGIHAYAFPWLKNVACLNSLLSPHHPPEPHIGHEYSLEIGHQSIHMGVLFNIETFRNKGHNDGLLVHQFFSLKDKNKWIKVWQYLFVKRRIQRLGSPRSDQLRPPAEPQVAFLWAVSQVWAIPSFGIVCGQYWRCWSKGSLPLERCCWRMRNSV